MAKKQLTEYLADAMVKSQTEEGRQELLEERERLDAEASQAVQDADQGAPETPEPDPEPPAVRPEDRVDPILPVVASVQDSPEREAGRMAFRGIIDLRRQDLPEPAQLPLLPAPGGPRVSLLELSDWRGVPTMARGRGAPLDLRLAVAACILTPHAARATRGRLNQPESPALAAPANTSNPRRARFPIPSTTVTTCHPSATSSAFSWKTLVEPT